MKERYCHKCGKPFFPVYNHRFNDAYGIYCTWPCYNHRYDDNPPTKIELYTRDGKLVKTYKGLTDAADSTGLNFKCIHRACKENIVYFGYLWRYKNDLL